MKLNSIVAKQVFAEPYRQDGVTVITAAKITGGGGGDSHDKNDEGGGFGFLARPSGAYVINEKGRVRWIPAIDINRLIATVGAIALAGLLVGARLARLRAGNTSA
jgi:hypothetical protein